MADVRTIATVRMIEEINERPDPCLDGPDIAGGSVLHRSTTILLVTATAYSAAVMSETGKRLYRRGELNILFV